MRGGQRGVDSVADESTMNVHVKLCVLYQERVNRRRICAL